MNHAQIDILGEKIVDSFAGGGGTSTGIELATGRVVDIAINHDPDAILMHQTNHPHTVHYEASVWDVDPEEECGGSPVGLFWASPDCKHFSKAKGGKPVDKKIRGLAWIVLRWAGKVHPRVIILENVEEFQTWGPVRRGKPVKSKAGQTFRRFVEQLKALRTIDAANRYGLTAASLVKYYSGDHAQDVKAPLHTVTTKDREGVVAASLSEFHGASTGGSPKETAGGGHHGIVTTRIVKAEAGAGLGHWPEIRELLNTYCGYTLGPQDVILLRIGGTWFFLADIGLRMLIPRELYRANGFPDDYKIDRDYLGNEYKKSKQVARCGNAVPPPFAEALVRANLPEWCGEKITTMEELERKVAV